MTSAFFGTIQKRPLVALLIALAVGIFVGYLLFGPSSHPKSWRGLSKGMWVHFELSNGIAHFESCPDANAAGMRISRFTDEILDIGPLTVEILRHGMSPNSDGDLRTFIDLPRSSTVIQLYEFPYDPKNKELFVPIR